MVDGQIKMWACRKCWTLKPRAEVELAGGSSVTDVEASKWMCPKCQTIGTFVNQDQPQFQEFELDLALYARNAWLHAAGWPVFSIRCAAGHHLQCPGHADDELACDCDCHPPSNS